MPSFRSCDLLLGRRKITPSTTAIRASPATTGIQILDGDFMYGCSPGAGAIGGVGTTGVAGAAGEPPGAYGDDLTAVAGAAINPASSFRNAERAVFASMSVGE